MADETTADIIAEKRRRASELESKIIAYKDNPSKDLALETLALSLVAENRNEADRLEAAYRREVATTKESLAVGNNGDCAKLREAVKAVMEVGYPHNFQIEPPHIRGYCYDITRAIDKCFAALDTISNQNTQEEN